MPALRLVRGALSDRRVGYAEVFPGYDACGAGMSIRGAEESRMSGYFTSPNVRGGNALFFASPFGRGRREAPGEGTGGVERLTPAGPHPNPLPQGEGEQQ